mgnify:CR=1 FL=1
MNAENIRFESMGGSSRLIYSVEDTGRLDSVDMEMIRRNSIPGVLSVSVVETEEQTELWYDITSLMGLDIVLQNQVTGEMLFHILEQIARALENAPDYLLDSDHFVLDSQYIFVNVSDKKVYLLLVPEEREPVQEALHQFMMDLLVRVQYDPSGHDGSFYFELRNFTLSNPAMSVAELHQKLRDMSAAAHAEEKKSSPGQITAQRADQPAAMREAAAAQNVIPGKEPVAVQNVMPGKETVAVPPHFGRKTKKTDVASDFFEEKTGRDSAQKKQGVSGKPEKTRKHFSLFGKKEPESAKAGAVSDPGFAMPGFDVPGETKKKSFFGGKKVPEERNEKQVPHVPGAVMKSGSTAPASVSVPAVEQIPAAPPVSAPVPAPVSFQEMEETQLWDESMESGAYLLADGTREKISIAGPVFRIGRNPGYVDYVIDNNSVGRIHMNLLQKDEGYFAVDINSKNGTFIDGNRLNPNMEYPLSDGCHLRVGSQGFTFHKQ